MAMGIEISTAPAAKLVYQLSMYSFSSMRHRPMATVYWSAVGPADHLAKMKSTQGAVKEVRIW